MKEPGVSSPNNVFRIAFWPLFRTATGIILLLTVALHFPRSSAALAFLLTILATQAVASGLIWWGFTALFPLRVTEEGLHGQTEIGAPCFQSWAEMEKVRPVPLTRQLGVPFVYIHSFQKGRRSLCIPLFLARFPAFRQAVRDMASPLNPLRLSLENDGEATERKSPIPQ